MDRRILFVHGLGGGEKTWGLFPELIKADVELEATTYFYKYPTPPLGIKLFYVLQNSYQNLQDLAKGLRTEIEHVHKDADEIILVGHSMGGLVVRQYLLDEYIAGKQPKVKKVILYAVPNEGSSFANLIGDLPTLLNPHLMQMCINSDFIDLLNQNWASSPLYADNKIDLTVVVGGNDKIVDRRSAEGIFRHLSPEHIPDASHLTIVKPESANSLTYRILRNSILKKKYLPNLKHKCSGLKDFGDWQKYRPQSDFAFCSDKERDVIYKGLSEELNKTSSCLRITGLSGLGKTRLVFEAVLKAPETIQNKVLYIDVANEVPNLQSWLQDAIDTQYEGILIVDNCKTKLHVGLAQEVSRSDSKIILITLDHYLENLSATTSKEFRLKPLSTDSIKTMLEPLFAKQVGQLERIALFAGGFPQMAVLISKARVANDPDVGRLNDDDLLNKLLGDISVSEKSILKACSLFDRFGFDGEVVDQYQFIADSIINSSHNECAECIKKFHNRGLIDISGRFAQVVPKPLAVRLASEWWIGTHRHTQTELLKIIPDSLVKPFCVQVSMLGFIDEVQELTKILCGPQGFFGQAEAILSDRGSLLFRSFVEVNPEATSRSIYRVLNDMDHVGLQNIKDDVRRNLVWALEKLAFHKSVFEEASWCLLLFASAENESWSNNASGQFEQLFGVWLSGTEADLQARIRVLKRGIELKDDKVEGVIIKALGHAISTHSGTRTIGAEYQGNRAPMEEYRPKIWQEIFDYWTEVVKMLIAIIEHGGIHAEEASKVIGRSIRGLVQNGRIEMLNIAIVKIIGLRGKYWPSAQESISHSLEYDSEGMPTDGVDALKKWESMLKPDDSDLGEKLKILVIDPPWEHKRGEDGHYINIAQIKAEQLASDLAQTTELQDEHINLLLKGQQKQSFSFGKRWALEAKSPHELIEKIIAKIVTTPELNLSLLLGLLAGVYELDSKEWEAYLEKFKESPELVKYYPDVLTTGIITPKHLVSFIDLIFALKLSPKSSSILSYGSVLSHLSSEVVTVFCLKVAEFDEHSKWIALDVLFMYCLGEKKFDECSNALKKIVSNVSLNKKSRSTNSDIYHWAETVAKFILPNEFDFCRAISNQIINATREKIEFDDLIHSIKPTLSKIFTLFGNQLWPDYGNALVSANGTELWELSHLLEREDSFGSQKPSILDDVSISILLSWCDDNIKKGPHILARIINIFTKNVNGNKIPSPLFVALLEKFGYLDDLGGEFTANLVSIGWIGSLVPYLESDKEALEPLLNHHSHNVREWVKKHIEYINKTIKYEQIRDSEHDAGIY
jgi:hypothetical protein